MEPVHEAETAEAQPHPPNPDHQQHRYGTDKDEALSTPSPTRPGAARSSGSTTTTTGGSANSTATATPSAQSSWSTCSDRQLGHGTTQPDPADRVFPIRSVISVEPPSGRCSGEHEYFPRSSSISIHDSSSSAATTLPGNETGARSPGERVPPMTPGPHGEGVTQHRAASFAADSLPSTLVSPFKSPPIERIRQRRMNTMSGSMSSVQADAERHGNVGPIPLTLDEPSDDEEDGSQSSGGTGGDAAGRSEDGGTSSTGPVEPLPESLYSHRFRHVMTDEGHAVITGRDGTLQRCEDEPIHAPGAVQAFGMMLVLREDADGRFDVRYVSENSKRLIGHTPQELFRLDNFMDILTEEQADNLYDHIDFIRDEDADPAINGPEVFSLSIRPPPGSQKKRSVKLWCAIHIHPSHPELVICEFEMDDDPDYPLRPVDEETPDAPEDTLHANPTTEELTESTEITSKPLRVLRSARKRRGEAGAMQVFDIMSQVQEQLASAPSLDRFLKILVGIVRELTGFHRVMVYQFDSFFNGKVVTELVDPAQTRDLYKGLHFPASDIPKQARDLYKLNKVRLLYDRDLETARIVCKSVEDLENPLDMTHSYLRAMSPIHLKYLANMAVRSSMSISINAFNQLWGLIACHSYGNKGMRVSFPIRKMCRLVGDTVSRNIERLSYASRLQARKLINTVPADKNPSGYIIASSDDLLKLFDADFGMLSIRGETKILGKIEHSQEALAMLEYLRLRSFTSVITTQDITVDFPDLRYPPGFSVVAGLLYVPLSVGGHDFIVFFRKGQVREVKWAGNPYEKIIQRGTTGYLEPRKSFKVWHETVVGKCREWSEEQVETAAVLCLVYGKFIEVWRQKEAALQSSRLTRLLLANSAHEVRTPLNAIINYLEIALEGTLDQETRDNLAKSHSASKSLIYVINDLLDLTKTEEGQELVKDEIFDFPACIREGTEPFQKDARRKGIAYEVIEHPGLPRYVYGDQRRVRQVVANVTANAIQHTARGSIKIELYVAELVRQENDNSRRVRIEIVVEDTGEGMTDTQLDGLFRDLEQVSTDLDYDQDQRAIEESQLGEDEREQKEKEKEQSPRKLGLGLAIVARILRNMDGQLRLKSEAGKGSKFVIQLPFDLPAEDDALSQGSSLGGLSEPQRSANDTASSVRAPASLSSQAGSQLSVATTGTLPKTQDGEVMLVDRGSNSNLNLAHTNANTTAISNAVSNSLSPWTKSVDDGTNSINSITSQRSTASRTSGWSGMSDADRLIDAIQMPLSLADRDGESHIHQRRRSRPFVNARSISPNGRETAEDGGGTSRPSAPNRSVSSPDKSLNVALPPRRPSAVETVGELGVPDQQQPDGMRFIPGSGVPLKPVRIPDDDEFRSVPAEQSQSRILLEASNHPQKEEQKKLAATPSTAATPSAKKEPGKAKLQVLIAEDDPINLKILRKRLEKAGHNVSHALNGEDCATVYGERSQSLDVVLMDMQMPIVDGLQSTRMIRALERDVESSGKHKGLSQIAAAHGRIPIFAVSASLVEREKDTYVDAGFDGWILKPIDFKRLETLMSGIVDDQVRDECLYTPGEWERGGWFRRRSDDGGEGGGEGGSNKSGSAKGGSEKGKGKGSAESTPRIGY